MVVDNRYELHSAASAFIASFRDEGDSVNTQRTYAIRVAQYLTWCAMFGVDWGDPTFRQLSSFKSWLVEEPLPSRGRKPPTERRYRSKGTANAILTTVFGFLRFCGLQDYAPASVVSKLTEPKQLTFAPPAHDPGENGQFRSISARKLKFKVAVPGYEWLTRAQVDAIIASALHARDRFLVHLMAATGVRIGEALGMRREDMHLLPDSRTVGCSVVGPHIHVVRREDNANGAVAKARQPRWIPVDEEFAGAYAAYQHERDEVTEAEGSDFVFVNLFRAPLGAAMKYPSTYELFKRLAKQAGFEANPHMCRHYAATEWIRAGVGRDVVQGFMGHVSPVSMNPYVHASDEEKRKAVDMVAARREAVK
ncbi:tyrosine-type recombinase/integrase [Actinacidiphila sp. ITFR-21]|uniref:tyrosine-type recombinase/integrase n=1 Tax=Actinacidiphila sp. ITFR-21 TaxID=3075199 RepID=UPI00288A89EC|nr:tyrosine-type recombinase/integrase [Streptomyces sp. ITFR-21]WNI16957.1 tyrosine-type recombinase/integrase [Streptomyces sp. ITFR-21]WNI20159.1 tyrosine-type recombinase/integrase [Streptomyces sp. ITFR-21]